ncbi:MAG: hypothetical protein JWN38_1176 [Candidatus Saccharibacteria bacterium]|nr:hypothetical protein [Candidatus Saccharibacteria bacterium]
MKITKEKVGGALAVATAIALGGVVLNHVNQSAEHGERKVQAETARQALNRIDAAANGVIVLQPHTKLRSSPEHLDGTSNDGEANNVVDTVPQGVTMSFGSAPHVPTKDGHTWYAVMPAGTDASKLTSPDAIVKAGVEFVDFTAASEQDHAAFYQDAKVYRGDSYPVTLGGDGQLTASENGQSFSYTMPVAQLNGPNAK